jgi:hypothetical protein
MAHSIYVFALVASAVWFSMATHYFGFRQTSAAKILVPRTSRESPLFLTVAAGLRFLGGMNAAFALMAILLLLSDFLSDELFASPVEQAILVAILGAAHFSQFIFNVPVLRNGERQGEAYWPVLSGPMRMIFIVDFLGAVVCFLAAGSLVSGD